MSSISQSLVQKQAERSGGYKCFEITTRAHFWHLLAHAYTTNTTLNCSTMQYTTTLNCAPPSIVCEYEDSQHLALHRDLTK
eukprot:34-Heterococcus_DN1.PRE.2